MERKYWGLGLMTTAIPLTAKCDVFRLWALLPMKLCFSRGHPSKCMLCAGRLIGAGVLPGGPALTEQFRRAPPPQKPKTSHLAVNRIGTTARPREIIMMANNVKPDDVKKDKLFRVKMDSSGYGWQGLT